MEIKPENQKSGFPIYRYTIGIYTYGVPVKDIQRALGIYT